MNASATFVAKLVDIHRLESQTLSGEIQIDTDHCTWLRSSEDES